MFDYSLIHWTSFFTAVTLLILMPGPSVLFVLGQSIRHGNKIGFIGMLGNWTGSLFHVFAATVGLSAILAASALAFTIVKWLGALYLVYLGIQAIRSGKGGFDLDISLEEKAADKALAWSIFKQGALVSILNPKTAMFFLAFLPQFIVEGAGPIWAQSALHGILFVVNAAVIEPAYLLVGAGLVSFLKRHKSIGVWINRTIGAMFLSLGIRLAFIER